MATLIKCHKNRRGALRVLGAASVLFAIIAIAAATAFSQAPKQLEFAPDIAARLAKYKPVKMHFDSSHLTGREKKMVAKLVDAAGLLDCVYWRQSDPNALTLYLLLPKSQDPREQELRELLKINGGRFDLIDENKPLVDTQPAPPGRALYPWGMTQKDLDTYVAAHPDQKSALYDPWTIV